MTCLLLVVALLTPKPWFWVERGPAGIMVSADLTGLFDAALARRLTSGLTTTLTTRLALRQHDDPSIHGEWQQTARVRWDLWAETLVVQIAGAPPPPRQYPSAQAFADELLKFRGIRIADDLPLDSTVYELHATLEVNPMTGEQLARTRRWLGDNQRSTGLDPQDRGLLGSFVRLFENFKPARAERTLRAKGRPFRGDRLPMRRARQSPEPSPPVREGAAPAPPLP